MEFYCEQCDVWIGEDGIDTNLRNAPSKKQGLCYNCQDKADRKKDFKTYLEMHEVLRDLAQEWIEEFGFHNDPYNVLIQVDNEKYPPIIEAEYTYYDSTRNCPGEYTGYETIPLSVLWDEEAFERERKKRQEANFAAVRKEQAEQAKRARLDKANRYETYLDLCKEFENE